MKLDNWLDIWLNKYIKNSVKLRTYNKYNFIIANHINPSLGNYNLKDLSLKELQEFANKKLFSGNLNTGEHLAVSTVKGIINVLKGALKFAKQNKKIKNEYVSAVKLPKITQKQITVFNFEEQSKIISYCLKAKTFNHIGVAMCLCTGIRIGELLALEWSDIDFEKQLMFVTKTSYTAKVNGTTKTVIDEPKTKNSNRVIPLPKVLCAYLKQNKPKNCLKYVISTKNGGIVQIRAYQKTYKRLLNKIDVPYKNFHSLRHTFATHAIEVGMDVKSLAEILGHTNASITLALYTHSMLEYKQAMINKMQNHYKIAV